MIGQEFRGRTRHVLELECHRIAGAGEGCEHCFVVIPRMGAKRRHLKRRRVLLVGIDVRLQPEARGRQCEHAPQLSAAENADRASRRYGSGETLVFAHCGASATLWVCRARHASSFFASFLSESARMAAA